MHSDRTNAQDHATCDSLPGKDNGCQTGCRSCQALRAFDEAVPPRHYVLGGLWIFVVPLLGMIAGCGVAAAWTGSPAWQAVAVAGGLAGGLAAGVLGRRVTVSTRPGRPHDVARG
jgi:hypothetical protein